MDTQLVFYSDIDNDSVQVVKSFDEYVNISEVYFECFAIVQDVDGYYGVIRDKKQDGLRKNNGD